MVHGSHSKAVSGIAVYTFVRICDLRKEQAQCIVLLLLAVQFQSKVASSLDQHHNLICQGDCVVTYPAFERYPCEGLHSAASSWSLGNQG